MTNEEAITVALENLGAAVGDTKRGYVHASCPLAKHRHEHGVDHNPSFGVVYDSGIAKKSEGHAHCFSCGYSGSVREIAALLYAYQDIDADTYADTIKTLDQITTQPQPLSIGQQNLADPFPDQEWMSSFPPLTPKFADAWQYMSSRGIGPDQIKEFDVRFDMMRYRVVFPIYDRSKRARGVIGRSLINSDDTPRYLYYPYPTLKGEAPKGFTWYNEDKLDTTKPVLVVEGIFDCLSAVRAYPNTVAALSIGFRTPAMGWHKDVKRWVSMFDTGAGGDRGRERLQKTMGKSAKVWHLQPPPGRDDPGDATPEEIIAQLNTLT